MTTEPQAQKSGPESPAKKHSEPLNPTPTEEQIMTESTEVFTTTIQGHEIHGLTVDLLSHWSKESIKFPAAHLPALVATLSDLAAEYVTGDRD